MGTFETSSSSLHGWTDAGGSAVTWKRVPAAVSSSVDQNNDDVNNNGEKPGSDHTHGNDRGHYMLADPNKDSGEYKLAMERAKL